MTYRVYSKPFRFLFPFLKLKVFYYHLRNQPNKTTLGRDFLALDKFINGSDYGMIASYSVFKNYMKKVKSSIHYQSCLAICSKIYPPVKNKTHNQTTHFDLLISYNHSLQNG